MNKKTLFPLSSFILLFFLVLVSADFPAPLPYVSDPVIPEGINLDIRDNLNIDLYSGSAVYLYSIKVPLGTNGLQPSLNIYYNSHGAKQNPGILGSGWKISESYIQRDINNTPLNVSDDQLNLFMQGNADNLVYRSNENRFYTKVNNFMLIENFSGGNNERGEYFIVKTNDGTAYRFGFNSDSEILSENYDYSRRLYLDLINDTYGNSIFYNYTESPYLNDVGSVYPDTIQYNNDIRRKIQFNFEDNDRADIRVAFYEEGDQVRDSRRLKEIKILVDSNLIRRYSFEYTSVEETKSLSFLSNITEYGSDGVTSLPSIKFSYNNVEDSWGSSQIVYPECNGSNDDLCFAGTTGGDKGVRIGDINLDGIIDIIKARDLGSGVGESEIWIHNGTGWNQSNWIYPECNANTDELCFVGLTHGDKGVRLIDINSDGLSDLIKARDIDGVSGTSEIWLNNGTGWKNSTEWKYPECSSTTRNLCIGGLSGQDKGVRVSDINSDGFPDIILGRDLGNGNGESEIWLNNGTGWKESTGLIYPSCTSGNVFLCFVRSDATDKGVRLDDLNGDGFPDIVMGRDLGGGAAVSEIWINNRTGWKNSSEWKHPMCNSGTDELCLAGSDGRDKGTRLIDLNTDGLIDLIKARDIDGVSGTSEIWLNNGTGWKNSTEWKYPGCNSQTRELCFTGTDGSNKGIRLIDLAGNGLGGIVKGIDQGGGVGTSDLWDNNASKSYLLRNITTQLGGIISIDYGKSTSFDNSGENTLGDIGFNIWVVTNITENNGVNGDQNTISITNYNYSGGLYDYENKEFRGFNYVEEKIGNKVIKNWFHQDESRDGLKYGIETLDNQGNLYKKAEKQWNFTLQDNYYVVELTQESEIVYDGVLDNPKIVNKTYEYDGFGNIISIHNLGDMDNSEDDKYEYFAYLNNTNLWIINKIRNHSLFDSTNSNKLTETFYSYDNLQYGTSPIRGSLTKKEDWLSGGSNPITRYGYNLTNGNLINETDSNGFTTKYIYGIRDLTQTFIDRVINSKNQTFNYNYDLGTGNLINETDSNGVIKSYKYDIFGRISNETKPYDSEDFPTVVYEYNFNGTAPNNVVIKTREQNKTGNTFDEYQFYDGFGRYIQTKKEAENSKQIILDIYYNNQSKVEKISNPYFASSSINYATPNQTINITLYKYDSLNRIINITNSDGTKKEIVYDHWNITVYDENGNKKDYEKNAFNKIIKVIEHNNGENYTTLYNYDFLDNLLSVTDSKNNIINHTYDTLGRKIKLIDFDLGTWTYTYDNIGNLIAQNDSNGNNITLIYDELNRKTKEITPELNKTYLYDINLNNTLSTVIAGDININYTYDARLRKVGEEKTIDGIAFTLEWNYDSLDREISNVLPDKDSITYSYNNQGLLNIVAGFLDIEYNQANNFIGILYNNLLSTNYTYQDNKLRLSKILTQGKQDLDYTYDNIGNVKTIEDNANSRSLSMAYDDLDRLISTDITDSENGQNHNLDFSYDRLGRLMQVIYNSQNHTYYYGNDPIHASTRFTIT